MIEDGEATIERGQSLHVQWLSTADEACALGLFPEPQRREGDQGLHGQQQDDDDCNDDPKVGKEQPGCPDGDQDPALPGNFGDRCNERHAAESTARESRRSNFERQSICSHSADTGRMNHFQVFV